MSLFQDKVLLITGGTGSFGNAVLRRFLTSDIREIRIFSRDEKKQDDMRHEYQVKYPEYAEKIKFYIGDVRNIDSIRPAIFSTLRRSSKCLPVNFSLWKPCEPMSLAPIMS